MELEPQFTTYLVQSINFLILFIAIVVAFLVFKDARKHRMSIPSSIAWAAFSLMTFPIGPFIYRFFGREKALPNSSANSRLQ